MSLAPRTKEGFAMLLLHAPAIARFVFRNTNFASERLESGAIKISMENNDYPIDHFRGFFYEWANYSGFSKASVTAAESAPRKFEYTISFIEAA